MRYVLEGSVRVEPDRVRVNVQLIDAITDEHLWAERFDKERKDILEVQDEIVARHFGNADIRESCYQQCEKNDVSSETS